MGGEDGWEGMVWKATWKRVECGRTVAVVGEGGLERRVRRKGVVSGVRASCQA